ncbi:decarboxylase [Billgrantia azerbaijanica]|nr:decarboxylase [Halomonas azerbaijanica]
MPTRQRLGILLPDDGPTDYEWYALNRSAAFQAGELPAIEVGKVASDGHHEHGALTALGAPERLAPIGESLVNETGAGAVVWACTSGSFIGGLEWAEAQSRELERRLGVPVTSTALAFRDALAALGARSVDLLGAYPQAVTQALAYFLGESRVTVEHVKALECSYAADSNRMDIMAEVRAFCAAHAGTERPLLVPDTAINSLELVEAMNRETGRVVLTANQVTLWAGLKLLQWPGRPVHYLSALAQAG